MGFNDRIRTGSLEPKEKTGEVLMLQKGKEERATA